MDRKQITAAVIEEADRLLAEGVDHAVVAARVGITEYVVRVMAEDQGRVGRMPPADTLGRRILNRQNCVDAATVRMIQRMLDVGWLTRCQIAREVGVSSNFVTAVARGKRLPISSERPPLDKGERFLKVPIRCEGCHAKITIVPCRACKARRVAYGWRGLANPDGSLGTSPPHHF